MGEWRKDLGGCQPAAGEAGTDSCKWQEIPVVEQGVAAGRHLCQELPDILQQLTGLGHSHAHSQPFSELQPSSPYVDRGHGIARALQTLLTVLSCATIASTPRQSLPTAYHFDHGACNLQFMFMARLTHTRIHTSMSSQYTLAALPALPALFAMRAARD